MPMALQGCSFLSEQGIASWPQRRASLGSLSACAGMSDSRCHGAGQGKRDILEKRCLTEKGKCWAAASTDIHSVKFILT